VIYDLSQVSGLLQSLVGHDQRSNNLPSTTIFGPLLKNQRNLKSPNMKFMYFFFFYLLLHHTSYSTLNSCILIVKFKFGYYSFFCFQNYTLLISWKLGPWYPCPRNTLFHLFYCNCINLGIGIRY
jgi:hypothetical protein